MVPECFIKFMVMSTPFFVIRYKSSIPNNVCHFTLYVQDCFLLVDYYQTRHGLVITKYVIHYNKMYFILNLIFILINKTKFSVSRYVMLYKYHKALNDLSRYVICPKRIIHNDDLRVNSLKLCSFNNCVIDTNQHVTWELLNRVET